MTDPFNTPEDDISWLIKATHSPNVDPFDANSLFIITANILKRSTQIVDQVMKGIFVTPEKVEDYPKESFRVPMCKLKNIGCELFNCKDPGPKLAHETALKVMKILPNYSWEAKAVLTLAAFAKEFGDMLHLDQANANDQLTKSLAILKGSLILPNTPQLRQKRQNAVVKLNDLLKETLEVMKLIFKYCTESPQRIAEFLKPINVYWIIITVIACANEVTLITNDEDKPHDLSSYYKKVSEYKSYLLSIIPDGRKPIQIPPAPVDEDQYERLIALSKFRSEVVRFLKLLFSAQDLDDRVPLIDCSDNYTTVDIDVVKNKKKVLFVVSWLGRNEISDDDLIILKRIQEEKIRKDYIAGQQYAIVWVPIEDEYWPAGRYKTGKGKEEFESLLRLKNIQWYTVNNLVLPKVSLRFLKEVWQFETSPIAVVMDLNRERIEYTYDAFYTMRLLGIEAFPFDKEAKEKKFKELSWITTFFRDILYQYLHLKNWVESGKYILLTGGTDNEWANEIERKVNIISRATNIRIEVFNINQELVKNLFWNGVETLLATLYEEEYAKKQLQRLYLYKQAQGWFVLNKGSTAVVVGPRETFLRVVDEIYEWKENISHITFEIAFKMYHEKIFSYIGTKVPPPLPPLPPLPEPPIVSITWKTINGCLIAEIPIDHVPTTADGKFSKRIVSCLTCHQSMEMIGVTYKCCHTTKPY